MSDTEVKPRNVLLVSLYIASLLPDDQVEFKTDIMMFVNNTLFYVAPEDMYISSKWILFEEIMKRHIKESDYPWSDSPWKQRIIDIYVGKTPMPEES